MAENEKPHVDGEPAELTEGGTSAAAGEPKGGDRELSPEAAAELLAGEAELIDVRHEHEWEKGRIAGARRVEVNDLPAEAEKLPRDRPLLIYCRGGSRSGMAAEALRAAGYDAHNIAGGLKAWAAAGLPLEPEGGYVSESGEAASILQAEGRFPEGHDPG